MLLSLSGGWLGLATAFVVFLFIVYLIYLWLRSVLRPEQPEPLKNDTSCKHIPPTPIKICRVCGQSYSNLNLTNCSKDGTPLEIVVQVCF